MTRILPMYEEKQKLYPLLILPLIIGLLFYLRVFTKEMQEEFWIANIFVPGLIVIFLFIFLNFFTLSIIITKDYFKFGFGLFSVTTPIKNIESCKVTDIKFRTYLGAGIRFGFDGTIAYNTGFGKGIKVKLKNRKHEYVISTKHAQKLASILNR